jgi:glycosyltransferase involved in cell wall biosynthesis
MRFSIIIPTYNRAALLKHAINSALGQSHEDREILVVDDGSKDETPSVAASFGEAIRYFPKENGGKAAAMNLGLAAAKGDVIVVLDDDDLFPPFTLARHAAALDRSPSADFSYGRFIRFRGMEALPKELSDKEFVPTNDPRRLVVKLMENSFLPNPAWAVRRQAQMKAGRYDPAMNFSQDYDMILRLARSNDGVFVDQPVLYQRKHLSYRGPSSEQTFILDSVEKWVKFDALLFRRIDREWSLSDFRPFPGAAASGADEALALLQKGVIFFQRKVYDIAFRALADYRRQRAGHAASEFEMRIATGLLGCRYGIADLVAGGSSNKEIVGALRAENWPLRVRVAFATQLRWRIRAALTTGNMRYALKLAQFSHQAFGARATAAVLGSRYSFGAREWRHSG